MAVSTLALLETSLKRAYADEYFNSHLNENAPFFEQVLKGTGVKSFRQDGEGFYWPFNLQSPQAIGTPGEGAVTPTTGQRTEVQGRVRTGQFVSAFNISWVLESIASAQGSWNGGEIKRHVKECVNDLTKHVNRIFAGTHGTGRVAQLSAGTSGTNVFIGKLPIGVLLLRPNMRISAFDDDTGSGGAEIADRKITKIVQSTRTVTFDGAVATMDADDHVYITGSYGQNTVPNGIRGLVDDGTNLTTVHNQSRDTYEELKSVRLSNSGTLRDLTEDLLLELVHGVRQRSGELVDCLLMNTGQFSKYLKFVRPDRRYNVTGGGVPNYDTGYKGGPFEPSAEFLHGGKVAKIYVSEDVFPREVYGLTKSQLRRLEQGKMDWVDYGGTMFQQGLVSGAYATSKQASLLYLANLATYKPAAHGVIVDLADKELCGSAVGGTDT
jgi:hypothetical protein